MRSPYNPKMVSASMGVYLFNTDVLIPVLLKDAEDPDSQPRFRPQHPAQHGGRLSVYSFNFMDENHKEALYWRDVGTLEAYYEANMDVAAVSPVFNLYDQQLADPRLSAAVSAGEVRLCRARPHRTVAYDSVSAGCIVSGGLCATACFRPTCA